MEARRQSVSWRYDYAPDLASIKAPVLLIYGPSIVIFNQIADSPVVLLSTCGPTGRRSRSRQSGGLVRPALPSERPAVA
jgi:hypothetical protein